MRKQEKEGTQCLRSYRKRPVLEKRNWILLLMWKMGLQSQLCPFLHKTNILDWTMAHHSFSQKYSLKIIKIWDFSSSFCLLITWWLLSSTINPGPNHTHMETKADKSAIAEGISLCKPLLDKFLITNKFINYLSSSFGARIHRPKTYLEFGFILTMK